MLGKVTFITFATVSQLLKKGPRKKWFLNPRNPEKTHAKNKIWIVRTSFNTKTLKGIAGAISSDTLREIALTVPLNPDRNDAPWYTCKQRMVQSIKYL